MASVHPVRYRLPVAYSTDIGRFITRWAYLEWLLKEVAYAMLTVDPKIGRLTIRETRVIDYLTMLEDVSALKRIKVSVDWKKLKNVLKDMETFRDKLAHGIWLQYDNTDVPVLRETSGKTVLKPGGVAVKSRILPRGRRVSKQSLKDAVRGLDHAVGLIIEIKKEVEASTQPSQ